MVYCVKTAVGIPMTIDCFDTGDQVLIFYAIVANKIISIILVSLSNIIVLVVVSVITIFIIIVIIVIVLVIVRITAVYVKKIILYFYIRLSKLCC